MNGPRIHPPELPDHLQWFNTESPLKLADQQGKVVLLDFWTYSCINCMHNLPDLQYLETKYHNSLTVIGIHSPKFPNEHIAENIQKAINRYDIRHPVANDPGMKLWQHYGIKSWPSIIYIDPDGSIVGILRGEGRRKQLDMMIQKSLESADKAGIRKYSEIPNNIQPEPESVLNFPGKILATPEYLYISDSGHNKVLVTNHQGRILRSYGSGARALLDGTGEETAFNNPQGLVLTDEYLYVADTGNHAIRRINLRNRDVATIAGTGKQGRHSEKLYDTPAETPLNSPWDLTHRNGILFIAMAGSHQIWRLDLNQNTIGGYAGNGGENIIDGDASESCFAQPSGLCYSGNTLYIVDSETSAIRALDTSSNKVDTLIGEGLFVFGDSDGPGSSARLQHPAGITCDQSRKLLWIADTYNHKIKKLDMASNEITTMDTDMPLAEPGGISILENTLWVANTNHHQILCTDLISELYTIINIHE